MSIDGVRSDSHDSFERRRVTIGQIKFDPSDELREKLSELYVPERRELGQRAIVLSSQYRMVSHRTVGGRLEGDDGQKASRLGRALELGKTHQNRLGRYMRMATRELDGHEFFALQFAVHPYPLTLQAIRSDEVLRAEALLRDDESNIKVVLVYETAHILDGKARERAIIKIGEFVAGFTSIAGPGAPDAPSPNRDAYVTNVRFRFSDPPSRG